MGRGTGTMWAGAIAALGVTGLVWLAWPDAPAIGGGAPAPSHADRPSGGDDDAPAITALALQSARFIEVDVTSCREEPGAGVEVIAERGGHTYSARAGETGLARIDVEGDGDVTVRARIGSFRSEPLAVDGRRASITACPGATVHGVVRDGRGVPEYERIVELVDVAGEVIDEVETDEDGTYLLADPMLDGASLVVISDGVDDEATRSLRPLAPREDRELDLIVGDVRTVVGWVLDMNGDPQPGVLVTASAETFGSRWVAFTDQGGGFVFEAVPSASLKVEADGGDLGAASARVSESEAVRREVSLTLEPSAHITVVAPEIAGTVEIRCWDPRFHGADGLDDAMTAELVDPYALEDGIVIDTRVDGSEQPAYDDGEIDDEAFVDSEPPDPDRMITAFEEALRSYDSSDPQTSVVRMMQMMMVEIPEMRDSFGQENGPLPDNPVEQERFLRELVAEEMRKNPQQFEMFALMAAEVQQGKSLMEAAQSAYGGWDEAVDEDIEVQLPEEEQGVADPAEPLDYNVPVAAQQAPFEDNEAEQIFMNDDAPVGDLYNPSPADEGFVTVTSDNTFQLTQPDGTTVVYDDDELYEEALLGAGPGSPASPETRAQAATGAVGEQIAVRASFAYEIVIRPTEGGNIYVGQVFVNPGDDLVIPFGEDGKMVMSGRVIDVDGQPIAGIEVDTYGATESATSDADGRFQATFDAAMALTWEVSFFDPGGRYEATSRRSITTVAGGARDLGTIVMRTAEEEPPGQMYQPYGGIGGLVTLDGLGVRLVDVEEGCPLEMSGIESGDTITTIDGVPAAELPMNELLLHLRGEAGTMVRLRVRTEAGELYDVGVQRDTIQPRSSWESPRHHDPVIRLDDVEIP